MKEKKKLHFLVLILLSKIVLRSSFCWNCARHQEKGNQAPQHDCCLSGTAAFLLPLMGTVCSTSLTATSQWDCPYQ